MNTDTAEAEIVEETARQPIRSLSQGELIKALCKARPSFGKISKDTRGTHGKYAALDTMLDAVLPALNVQGLDLSFDSEYSGERCFKVCRLDHESGQWRTHRLEMEVEPPKMSRQGKEINNKMQMIGIASSYASRYVLMDALAIRPDDEDSDRAGGAGRGGGGKAPKKCPKCGKAAIIQSKEEYGGGWYCFPKKGGCGERFPKSHIFGPGAAPPKDQKSPPAPPAQSRAKRSTPPGSDDPSPPAGQAPSMDERERFLKAKLLGGKIDVAIAAINSWVAATDEAAPRIGEEPMKGERAEFYKIVGTRRQDAQGKDAGPGWTKPQLYEHWLTFFGSDGDEDGKAAFYGLPADLLSLLKIFYAYVNPPAGREVEMIKPQEIGAIRELMTECGRTLADLKKSIDFDRPWPRTLQQLTESEGQAVVAWLKGVS